MRDLDLVPVVAVGGAAGAAARFAVDTAVPHGEGQWPWSTFAVNAVGSLALGVLLVAVLRWSDRGGRWPRWSRPFLITGVLGGFTTFSAYAVQVRDLGAAGSPALAVTYALASVVLCVGAVSLGLAAGNRIWPVPRSLTPAELDET